MKNITLMFTVFFAFILQTHAQSIIKATSSDASQHIN